MATTPPYQPQYISPLPSPHEVVGAAWAKAEQMTVRYDQIVNGNFEEAMRRAQGGASMLPAYLQFDAEVPVPDVEIPRLAEGASLEMFDNWWNGIIDKLAGLYAGYMDRYFPNDCEYLKHAQQWICNAITQGGTGLNPVVEGQIWERDRGRILREAGRAEQEAVSMFAARGFPLPPGALNGALNRIQADTRDKLAQASRDVAIKQAELEVENVRFAVQQAIGLYGTAISAAKDYMAAMAGSANSPVQLLPSVTDSQSRLIAAASDYYRSRISAKELQLKAAMPNAEYQQQANSKNLDAKVQTIKNSVDAAVEAAKALATQAAALLNSVHTSASISGSRGYSNSVGYSYSGEVTSDVYPVEYPA